MKRVSWTRVSGVTDGILPGTLCGAGDPIGLRRVGRDGVSVFEALEGSTTGSDPVGNPGPDLGERRASSTEGTI